MSRRNEQRVSITMTDFDMYCAARVERDKLKAENEELRKGYADLQQANRHLQLRDDYVTGCLV